MLPDIKTPLIWLLGVLLVAALGVAGIERTQAAKAKQALSAEKLDRSQVNEARSRAALKYVEKVASDQSAHATIQQGISSDLANETVLRVAADGRAAAADKRLYVAAQALRGALDRADSEAGGSPEKHPVDRPDTINRLLADGGQLLARSGELVGAGERLVSRRDAEVKALKAVVENDRQLFKTDLN